MKTQTTLGERLRAAREKKGYTQQQLADFVSCPQQQIQKIEAGTIKNPNGALVAELARVLEVPTAWLGYGEEIKNISEEAFKIAQRYDSLFILDDMPHHTQEMTPSSG